MKVGPKHHSFIDGLKMYSYLLASIYQVAYYIPEGFYLDLLSAQYMAQYYTISLFAQMTYAIENFILINVFCSTLSLLDRKKQLQVSELPALYLRKWLRLAVVYYPVWLLLYCCLPSLLRGPFASKGLKGMECNETWPTLLFLGNLVPSNNF